MLIRHTAILPDSVVWINFAGNRTPCECLPLRTGIDDAARALAPAQVSRTRKICAGATANRHHRLPSPQGIRQRNGPLLVRRDGDIACAQ